MLHHQLCPFKNPGNVWPLPWDVQPQLSPPASPSSCCLSAQEPSSLSRVLLSSLSTALSHTHLSFPWGQTEVSLTQPLPQSKDSYVPTTIAPQAGHARCRVYDEKTSVKMSFSVQLTHNLQFWKAQSHVIHADFTPFLLFTSTRLHTK